MNNKKVIIAIIAAVLGLLLILLSRFGLYVPSVAKTTVVPQTETSKPVLVSTEPAFPDGTILLPTQKIVLTFSQSLVNEPETKIKFDPQIDFEIKLSNDNKTATITPKPTYPIGAEMTLFVMSDTKFQTQQRMDGDVVLHFKTLNYNGI